MSKEIKMLRLKCAFGKIWISSTKSYFMQTEARQP